MAFTFQTNSINSKPAVLGKWYSRGYGNYYKSVDRADIARSYNFKSGSRIEFSSCTDMCGCMRETVAGKYEWENDSIISVKYTKSKYWRETTFHPLKEKRSERLLIKKINKGLYISQLR